MLGPLLTLTRQREGLIAHMLLEPKTYVQAEHFTLHARGDTRVVQIAAGDHDPLDFDFDFGTLGWAFGAASGLIVTEPLYTLADLDEMSTFGRWWSTSPAFVVALHVNSSAQKARWLDFASSFLRPDTPIRTFSAGCALNSAFPSKRSH